MYQHKRGSTGKRIKKYDGKKVFRETATPPANGYQLRLLADMYGYKQKSRSPAT